jgi:hypothetical protein
MTRTATISSSALRQNQRKKTIAMTKKQEIRKRTLDGAVAYNIEGNVFFLDGRIGIRSHLRIQLTKFSKNIFLPRK